MKPRQLSLLAGAGQATTSSPELVLDAQASRAIEDEAAFPFEALSEIAELESWRKEVHRPLYHIHKWWAQRLGSVFRAILVGTFAPRGADVLRLFYEPVRVPGAVVFDPFMGSGTTLGEALKLGARAVGRDINPVSHFIVRNALGVHPRADVLRTFRAIAADVAPTILRFYRTTLPGGGTADVLYYFWVKILSCPSCHASVDLFSSYVFSQHAYPSRHPEARALCPRCGAVNDIRYDATQAECAACRQPFAPQAGPARGITATCPHCESAFPIAKTARAASGPPRHRLYAKLVLLPDGQKAYLPANDSDRDLHDEASRALSEREGAYPVVEIHPGYNTNQVLNYNYRHWHEMFNDRQLYCLSVLAERIRAVPQENLRDVFACLFSGVLEFNNMFASFKGEGTGAVRHMFSHHILKPQRTPLEANVWGTPRSSGSFLTLFEGRLLRALDYCEDPSEIAVSREGRRLASRKVFGLSCPVGHKNAPDWESFVPDSALFVSCGDSSQTGFPAESVDAVVTDPPFFDNVHYSQLADFFYVWQRHVIGTNGNHTRSTTRTEAEVQQTDPDTFASRLGGVWRECHRVLKRQGLLVFTYHHSRAEGWRCVLDALMSAGFVIVAVHPIKAEMSVAAPKHQASEPIDLDMILVCRKRGLEAATDRDEGIEAARGAAAEQIRRLRAAGRRLSQNDARVVLMAQTIKALSRWPQRQAALERLDRLCAPAEREAPAARRTRSTPTAAPA